MMERSNFYDRRSFIKGSAMGLVGGMLSSANMAVGSSVSQLSPVAVTSGDDRRENILRGLELVKANILRGAKGKRILIKPNMVNFDGAWGGNASLSSSHVDQLEIVVDWFRHLGFKGMVIAESTPNGMTLNGFETMGYTNLGRKGDVLFKDLNQEGYRTLSISGSVGKVRVSRLVWDREYYVVSLAKLKTHNNVVATFSGKNIIMGSPIIDVGKLKGRSGQSDKGLMHGDSNQDLHDNLFKLAYKGVRPDLAVIDGFEGMQGKGPIWGTSIKSKVSVVSTDWLAADRVCCDLIDIEGGLKKRGLNPELPAYLRYCGQAGLGNFDPLKIQLMGDPVRDLKKTYALHEQVEDMIGMEQMAPIYRS